MATMRTGVIAVFIGGSAYEVPKVANALCAKVPLLPKSSHALETAQLSTSGKKEHTRDFFYCHDEKFC